MAETGKTMTDRDATALIDALKDEDAETRWSAAQALGGLAPTAAVGPLVEPLCAVLNKPHGVDNDLREAVARALGFLGDPAAVTALVTGFGYYPRSVKTTTHYAILRIGPAAIGPLVAELGNENREFGLSDVKCGIARVLGEFGDATATEPLLELIASNDQAVCEAAIFAFDGIKDPRAVEPLVKVLRERRDWAKALAASALSEIGTPALDSLVALLDNQESPTVRFFALSALGELGDPSATDAVRNLLSDTDIGEKASKTLEEIGQGGVPSLRPPRLEGGEFKLSTCLSRLREGMDALEARELVGSPQFRMDQSTGLAALGFDASPSGTENWVYKTEFGTFQIVVRESEEEDPTVVDLLSVEAVMEQAKAAGQ
jgi:HEAT repeat protein